MTKIGRKIYYEIFTGNVILDTGEMEGPVIATSIEQDISAYAVLTKRNRETFDVLELPFGAYKQDFAESSGYQVNVETKELVFSYPDENEPEAEPVFVKPLSEQIEDMQTNMDNAVLELTMLIAMGGMPNV